MFAKFCFYAALVFGSLLIACKKDAEPVEPDTKNTVSVEFDNRVGDQKLVLGTTSYKNGSGEAFTVSAFNYFVSNLSLTKEDGNVLTFPNQYFLIRQADATTQTIALDNVPAGNYNQITFTIGVDSLKSVKPLSERTGVLNPASYGSDSMYWSPNLGYRFMKLEGSSPAVPVTVDAAPRFSLQVGGYGGGFNGDVKTANNLRTVTLPMTKSATVRGNIAPEIHLFVNALTIFDGNTRISLTTTSHVDNPTTATPIADNYKAMFMVDHVHNDPQ